ncbi:MAG: YabP/YqfC family sporulation protein [Clostridia bacterium]|nr:YabP/YqfC family sporulation protein [Clostridia bacterium]
MNEQSDITVSSRKRAVIDGVAGILGFNSTEALFSTALGRVVISGSGLSVDGFDREAGKVTVNGKIDAVFYPAERKEAGNLFKNLFGRRK